jgi:hypothetical protein
MASHPASDDRRPVARPCVALQSADSRYATRATDNHSSSPRTGPGRDRLTAVGIFVLLFVVYNSNGREIGSYDTQATKFAARELLLRGTLNLNHVVGATPEYASRWGFILAADGNYRSVYSPVPAVIAAGVTWPLWKTGLVDIRAPLAPALIAVLAASILVSLAVTFAFLHARQSLPRGRAVLLAAGLGLGTGFWNMASRTLWQTETAVFGLGLAVLAFATPGERISGRGAIAIGLGLGLTGATRPQLAPIVAVLLAGTWIRAHPRHAAAATALVGGVMLCAFAANLRWFGHPLGALPLLQEMNAQVHRTAASFEVRAEGLVGLLISPSRGLFVFSPVVLVAVAGMSRSLAAGWRLAPRWCLLAILAQFGLYGSYAVWWGGHTYGPRYLVDALPVAVPLAVVAMARPRGPGARVLAGAALVWSIVVAATGAFCYPHDRWNGDPTDIDRDHARLWSISDNQIARCWQRGPSPQNFSLLDRAAVRRPFE